MENLYVIFRVSPYHRNIARAMLKAPKYYFYDTGQVVGNPGVKLENLAACALLKEIHCREDCFGERGSLHYVRNKEGKGIDFLVVMNGIPILLVETKWSDDRPAGFSAFERYFPGVKKVQIVSELKRQRVYPGGLFVAQAQEWLSRLELNTR